MTQISSVRRPVPVPTPETRPYWEGCGNHKLVLPRCRQCSKFHFYPRAICPYCWSPDLEWQQVSGRATLYSYVINHRPAPGFEAVAPYSLAVVELEEGPRMFTNIVGVPQTPDALQLDMPLEVVFEDLNGEIALPKFRPATR